MFLLLSLLSAILGMILALLAALDPSTATAATPVIYLAVVSALAVAVALWSIANSATRPMQRSFTVLATALALLTMLAASHLGHTLLFVTMAVSMLFLFACRQNAGRKAYP